MTLRAVAPVSISGTALVGGTPNGVLYLDNFGFLSSGSGLTFDGSVFAAVGADGALGIVSKSPSGAIALLPYLDSTNGAKLAAYNAAISAFSHLTIDGTYLRFNTSNAEQMRLTSTGLGIGTSSPTRQLQVSNASNAIISVLNGSKEGVFNATTSSINIGTASNDFLTISTNGFERLRVDTSGNLGLGVTPSAWWSQAKAIDLPGGSLWGASTNNIRLISNSYFNGTNYIYRSTAAAASYEMYGNHVWFVAPSGTAGNPISFTQAMTLDASGNLLVGQTSAGYANSNSYCYEKTNGYGLYSHVNGTATAVPYLGFAYNGSEIGSITQNGTTAVAYNTSSDYRLKNVTGPITTSGQYIDALKPVEGTWKADGSTFVGLIAHEVQEVSRTQVATGEKDGEQMQGMDYSSAEIIANLIAELQSVRQRLAALEAK